jgi:hypothetical protein
MHGGNGPIHAVSVRTNVRAGKQNSPTHVHIYGRSWNATISTVDAPRYGLWVTDFTMVRGAAAYQYVVVITASYWLLIGDVPLSQPFDTSLNASNSPAGTAILSCATCVYRKPCPG